MMRISTRKKYKNKSKEEDKSSTKDKE